MPRSTRRARATILLGAGADSASEAIGRALRSDGYKIVHATNTVEFVDYLNETWLEPACGPTVELVILALVEPPWANLAMLEYIRKGAWAMPVFVVGARGIEADRDEARRLGATIVFARPFDPEDLRAAVGTFVPTGEPRVPSR